MGACCSTEATATVASARGNTIPVKDNAHPVKDIAIPSENAETLEKIQEKHQQTEVEAVKKRSPFFPFSSPTPAHHLFTKKFPPAATPKRFFKRATSPAKHIREALVRRQGKPKEAVAEGGNKEGAGGGDSGGGGSGRLKLDKGFGYKKGFGKEYEMGEEIGKGHFAYTCKAKFKKGDLKGQEVAVKVIPKAQMTTSIAIEDARREVKILRALTGHNNTVKFYDAFEDHENVYIVMELCEGGELLDRILSRGGKYTEDDAKVILIQILNFVSFCHLQGVVHRDLKPENFLFTSKEENSQLKAIDFGLSDFVMPDERLNDIVGSSYYVAPEVLHRSYNTEADVWSIGVIAYILLCGIRPFWARTESGIFRAVLKADLCFDEPRWLSLSSEAKDFIKHLLKKDPRKRMTAAQALSHPWIKNNNDEKVPLDILILKLMKAYMHSSALRKAALQAVAKTLTVDEQFYLKEQFTLLEPTESGTISLNNIKAALTIHATDAMNESHILEFLASLNALQNRGMDFEEFCAATLSVHQLESRDRWEQHARHAYELFDKNGNRTIVVEELASELGVGPSVPVHAVLHDWIRHTDGKLSFLGFVKLLRGLSGRSLAKAR